ncbi:DUF58 domain-containing protein [Colwellia sp. BRX10-3]|uniref:DUF58 domain-containing protein n=1 Tax=Colwellia sp. BRX10-3 TaxID=2759844 RepID=UPI0015F4A1FF|nr:DUF58 domain-containing protein [Colwellia sp. BRX10-3]MBA6391354.1 DUF58 domain-containing protein [Colwellia sp. BRX10-3]
MQQPYFDAKTLLCVKDLPLAIKALAQGFLHGAHASQQRGVGIEFSQFRAYEPGDELSKIDWKLFARSDKYFVREAERESNINVWLVLDCSESMLQQSRSSSGEALEQSSPIGQWNKLTYARYLAATIAYLAQKQGDSVGFLALSGEKQQQVAALPGERHWQKILLALTQLKASGTFPDIKAILTQLSAVRKNGLVVVISDFHQLNNELLTLTSKLSNRYTDVVAFHLDSDDEINFPYQGLVKFQDLETGEQCNVSAKQVRAGYLENKQLADDALKAELALQNIQYVKANIDQALDQTLVDFLSVRARGSRR